NSGYKVLVASNGAEALEVVSAIGDKIDLVLSDVVMPEMGGAELAERMESLGITMPIVYMSGYTDAAFQALRTTLARKQVRILEKPFTEASVLLAVRNALDEQ